MRTITVTTNIYKFNELTLDVQRKVLEDFCNDSNLNEFAVHEGLNSLKAYCEHFRVSLEDYQIGAYCHNYAKTDANNSHFRGLKLKDCDPDYMPTGFCIDWNFFNEFYEEFKRTGDAKQSFEYGLERGLSAIERDCESCYEEDSLIAMIEANEYEFLENGERA